MKHTPGPWTVEENNAYYTSYIIRGGAAGNKIAQCFNWQDRGFDIASEHNARLIADAPRLSEENETCRLALQNLSACGYGQTLTQSVAGIAELVKAFRESDTKLHDENERLKNAMREMVRRTYNETELRSIAREALDSCENRFY